MSALTAISVTDSSGGTIAIAAYNQRTHLILRISGSDVWIGFNESATEDKGIFLKNGEIWTDTTNKCQSAMYFVCAAGGSATVYAETQES